MPTKGTRHVKSVAVAISLPIELKERLEEAKELGVRINLSKTLQHALIKKLERLDKFKEWEKGKES